MTGDPDRMPRRGGGRPDRGGARVGRHRPAVPAAAPLAAPAAIRAAARDVPAPRVERPRRPGPGSASARLVEGSDGLVVIDGRRARSAGRGAAAPVGDPPPARATPIAGLRARVVEDDAIAVEAEAGHPDHEAVAAPSAPPLAGRNARAVAAESPSAPGAPPVSTIGD